MSKAAFALVAGLSMAAPTVALAESARPVAAHVETVAATPSSAPSQASSSYAEREAQSKDAQNFEGGATVVIFSGAALVALILLLLII